MVPRARILLVDDEPDILRLLSYNLKKRGYQTDEVRDGEEALRRVREHSYQLIILDLMLPGLSGMEICCILKQNPKTSSVPVIMLTARSEEMDKVAGLESGAEDYITKPFGVREFLARVKTALRRAEGTKAVDGILRAGALEIDLERHRARAGDKLLELSPTEFRLLRFLMERRGKVFSRDHILDSVWKGDAFVEQRTVDVHIRRLRAELERAGAGRYIQTVRGVGYNFAEED